MSCKEDLKQASNWKNTQPLFKKDHQPKGIKYKFLYYRLQFIEEKQFIRIKERDLRKIFIIEKCSISPRKNHQTNILTYNRIDQSLSVDLEDFSDNKISNTKGYKSIFVKTD